jgi:hypothetical protein
VARRGKRHFLKIARIEKNHEQSTSHHPDCNGGAELGNARQA